MIWERRMFRGEVAVFIAIALPPEAAAKTFLSVHEGLSDTMDCPGQTLT